ncbi:Myb-like DNA-binding protein [Phytophthora megakarya]|uniref:Myb-like DNA-binding protein n=1 Tax=Phytophthora megakarya TaxID=4795 RepID=A0A225VFU1_9STRA|nr:Myb-like DNA-binding protein [Phytophthora megakarya]
MLTVHVTCVYRSKRERDTADEALRSFHEVPSDAQKPRAEEEKGKRWTPEQDDALRKAVEEFGQRNWKAIASRVDGRNHAQCLQRWNKVLKPGLVKGHWSFEEDSTLEQMVLQGCHSWGEVAAHIPGRTAKQCRERWRNHLDPSINKSPFTPEEDTMIQEGFEKMGNRWTQIAELLPGRTEDAVKLRWKALNPNQKVKAKPGRPKLMPGMTVNKQRSTAPPTPDDVAATLMNGPITMPELPAYANGYPAPIPYTDNSAPITPMLMPHHHPSQMVMPHEEQHLPTTPMLNQYPEPIVEPLSDEVKAADEINDAAILKELLRSHSNSLLSFGSARGLSSFTDMSPEDLLASGELDEMFRATVSISKEKVERGRLSSTSSMMDSLTSSFKNRESLQKAVQNLDHEDKHLFQGLIDSWRAQKTTGADTSIQDDHIANLPVEPNAYSQHNFETSSGRNLTPSLDYEETRSLPRRNSNGISYELGNISNDIDDLLDSDLMRPIRKGKMC